MSPEPAFWTHGSKWTRAEMVVRRPELDEILGGYMAPYGHVLVAPRQSGKSTLLKQLQQELSGRGIKAGYLSLECYSESDLLRDQEAFYKDLAAKVFESLGVSPAPLVEARNFFSHLPRNCWLLWDEIHYAGTQGNVFHLMRGALEHTGSFKVVLADRTHPTEYMCDLGSPFNIAPTIYLRDLPQRQTVELIDLGLLYSGCPTVDTKVGEAVYALTLGHPYLTQRLGVLALEEATRTGSTSTTLEHLGDAKKRLLCEGDIHFRHLQRVVEQLEPRQLGKLKNVLGGVSVYFDALDHNLGLLFSHGLVRQNPNDRTDTQIRNPLYAEFLKTHLK